MVNETFPGALKAEQTTAPVLAITAVYKDPNNGATYVHKDLAEVTAAWADEEHKSILPPINSVQKFGDVESFVAYVQRFGKPAATFLKWNSSGMTAILDYHGADGTPGRCQWQAFYGFTPSPEWSKWTALANGHPVPHAKAVEALEDMAEDIVDPPAADLMNLLRTLKGESNTNAEVEYRPDGTSSLTFKKDSTVTTRGLALPESIRINIPALLGHMDADGAKVRFAFAVRLRVQEDGGKVSFRFTIPAADKVLELVYAERVQSAKDALGSDYAILRAANG